MLRIWQRELIYEIDGNRISVDRRVLADQIVKTQPFYAMLRARAEELDGKGWKADAAYAEPLFESACAIGPHQPVIPLRGE